MKRALAMVVVLCSFACGRESDVALPSPSPFPTASPTAEPLPSVAPDGTAEPIETEEPAGTDQTPAPTDRCRDSTEERCGAFRWDPEPEDNGDLSVKVSSSPKSPKAGDAVTFTIVAKDDGGTPEFRSAIFGDGTVKGNDDECEKQAKPYGPWTPPDKDPQDNTDTITFTYERPGNYEAIFRYSTQRCDYYDLNPYGSDGRGTVKVDVAPNITPRPSG